MNILNILTAITLGCCLLFSGGYDDVMSKSDIEKVISENLK